MRRLGTMLTAACCSRLIDAREHGAGRDARAAPRADGARDSRACGRSSAAATHADANDGEASRADAAKRARATTEPASSPRRRRPSAPPTVGRRPPTSTPPSARRPALRSAILGPRPARRLRLAALRGLVARGAEEHVHVPALRADGRREHRAAPRALHGARVRALPQARAREETAQNGRRRAHRRADGRGHERLRRSRFEQAWLQYDVNDWLKLRAGDVLVPLGRFNLNHDDNRWDIPRRSLVDRGVSVLPAPAAWDELGVGFLGDMPVGEQGQFIVPGATS